MLNYLYWQVRSKYKVSLTIRLHGKRFKKPKLMRFMIFNTKSRMAMKKPTIEKKRYAPLVAIIKSGSAPPGFKTAAAETHPQNWKIININRSMPVIEGRYFLLNPALCGVVVASCWTVGAFCTFVKPGPWF